jgi:hypothetical protein
MTQSEVQNLVDMLLKAFQTFQAQNTASNTNTTTDFATPQDAGAVPVPVIDAIELGDAAL